MVNQEKILYQKKRSAQALVSLLQVAKQLKLHVLSHKTLAFLMQMMEVDTQLESDQLSKLRE